MTRSTSSGSYLKEGKVRSVVKRGGEKIGKSKLRARESYMESLRASYLQSM